MMAIGTAAARVSPAEIDASTTAEPSVEAFLHALARAVRQFHTYPSSSPHCRAAVAEAHRALDLLPLESLVCAVTPCALLVSGVAIGHNTPVEHELARRLYESRSQTLTVERTATARDLDRLCTEL